MLSGLDACGFSTPPAKDGPHQIAGDCKTMGRSLDQGKGNSSLHVASAFATRTGLTPAPRVVSGKRGEAEAHLPVPEGSI